MSARDRRASPDAGGSSWRDFRRDTNEQGKGYGKALFRNALLRALAGADAIGGRAFLVQAKDEDVRAFYLKFGMEESPTNTLYLFMLLKDIRISLKSTSSISY